MAAIGEKEIKALIRSGDIGGAFLLFGTESYLKEFYSSKLKDKAVSPDFADFNYHFFDGASDRKSTRLNSSHREKSRMPSSA